MTAPHCRQSSSRRSVKSLPSGSTEFGCAIRRRMPRGPAPQRCHSSVACIDVSVTGRGPRVGSGVGRLRLSGPRSRLHHGVHPGDGRYPVARYVAAARVAASISAAVASSQERTRRSSVR